jgi:hypothetical protein
MREDENDKMEGSEGKENRLNARESGQNILSVENFLNLPLSSWILFFSHLLVFPLNLFLSL